jgi:hypothetical protein
MSNLNWNGITSNGYVSNNTVITGSSNIAIGYSSGSYVVDINRDLIEYIDFAFGVMGIDLTYEDFKKMSPDEKKSFLRDIKINKII